MAANWHDLFKYTHMGRAIMAAMTAVSENIAGDGLDLAVGY